MAQEVESGPPYRINEETMKPSEALTKILINAQYDHGKCVATALKEGVDPAEKCALTWGEVHLRWQQWAAYRAPFKFPEVTEYLKKYWSPKQIASYEKYCAGKGLDVQQPDD